MDVLCGKHNYLDNGFFDSLIFVTFWQRTKLILMYIVIPLLKYVCNIKEKKTLPENLLSLI